MIQYDIDSSVSKDTILYLRTLDSELVDAIKALLNKYGFRNIVVSYVFHLKETSKGQAHRFLVSSNASETIEKSSTIANAIYSFLSSREKELNEFVRDGQLLEINVQFANKANTTTPQNNDYGQSKKDDLPYYAPIKPRYTFDQIILPDHLRQ